MKVQCIHKNGNRVPDEVLGLGNTPQSVFPVQFGTEYTVYAISLWQRVLHYLVINQLNWRPDWIPACLFQVIDSRLPYSWRYQYWQEISAFGAQAIWGYDEICAADGTHYVDLIERTEDALRVFEDRRAEIDEAVVDS